MNEGLTRGVKKFTKTENGEFIPSDELENEIPTQDENGTHKEVDDIKVAPWLLEDELEKSENEIPKFMGNFIEEEKVEEKVVPDISKTINKKKFTSIRDKKKSEKKEKQAALNKTEAGLPSETEELPVPEENQPQNEEEINSKIDEMYEEVKSQKSAEILEEEPTERTPKEWYKKLGGLIDRFVDVAVNKVDGAIDNVEEFFSKKKEYLATRKKELDEKIQEFGKTEGTFRFVGENYNKLSTREKIGIGIALGLGAGGLAASSVPAAFAFYGGIAAQRTFGFASSFLKYEKTSSSKEKALAKTIGYQIAVTAGMAGLVWGVKEGVEHSDVMFDWLKNHWPGHSAPIAQTPDTIIPPGIVQPILAPEPEMPKISVEASSGHGYEYMTKQLWEQLHNPDNHFVLPPNTDPNSDIAKLFASDESSIDKVVHQIASDPNHHFFNADGSSVQINSTDHLAIASDGQIRITTPDYSNVTAQVGEPVTPSYPPEAHTTLEPPIEKVIQVEQPAHTIEKVIPVETPAHTIENKIMPTETHETHAEAPANPASEVIQQPSEILQRHMEGNNTISEFTLNDENLKNVKFTIETLNNGESKINFDGSFFNSQESINKHLTENWDQEIINKGGSLELGRGQVLETARYLEMNERALAYLENNNLGNSDEANAIKSAIENTITTTEKTYGNVFNDSFGADGVEPPTPSVGPAEVPSATTTEVPAIHENIVVNSSGLEIPTDESHIYADTGNNHLLVYGGSQEDKMKAISAYFVNDPDKIVYSADANGDHRIPWRLVEGKLTPESPVVTKGLFGFFKSFMEAPATEEFKTLIK